MKILYYTDVFPPVIVNYATNLVNGLASYAGFQESEVKVVTRTPAGAFDDSGLPYPVIRRPSPFKLWHLLQESDLIHLAGPCLLPLFFAWVARKPSVIEHHGYQAACPNGLFLYHPTKTPCPGHFQSGRKLECLRCNIGTEGVGKSALSLLLALPRHWLANRVHANICITHHVRDRLQLPYSTVVYYGIRDSNHHNSPQNGNQGSTCFAYAGRLVSEKGLDLLIQAAHCLRAAGCEFRVKFIGDGPERSRLQETVKSLGLATQVVFTGSLQGEALQAALNDVAVMVMPSIWEETAGLSAIEQMMRGRLVIAANIGGLGEVVGDAGLKFSPGDIEGLAACMKRVLDQPSLVSLLGDKARRRALELFRHERMVAEHVALYRELARGSNPSLQRRPSSSSVRFGWKAFWQALFVIWIILVNFLYYAQFKALVLSRWGHFLHTWH